MKQISREAIIRMTGKGQRTGSVSMSGGGGAGGGVSEEWVEGNYISKAFFSRLFTIHSASSTITPNDNSTTVASIEANVGLWTQQFLSALGEGSGGGGGGGATALSQLTDVQLGTLSDGQALVWSTAAGKWVNSGSVGAGTVTSVGLTMPTGFIVNNTPITGADTFNVQFASGYSLPTTAQQNQWTTAYNWGNHATAGYATQTWIQQQGFATNVQGTFWGRSWTNGGTVSGNIENATNIYASGSVYLNNNHQVFMKDTNGSNIDVMKFNAINQLNVGVGSRENGYRTDVQGHDIYFIVNSASAVEALRLYNSGVCHVVQGQLRIGDALLTWDSTANALRVTNVNSGATASITATGDVVALQN